MTNFILQNASERQRVSRILTDSNTQVKESKENFTANEAQQE